MSCHSFWKMSNPPPPTYLCNSFLPYPLCLREYGLAQVLEHPSEEAMVPSSNQDQGRLKKTVVLFIMDDFIRGKFKIVCNSADSNGK